MKKVLLSVFATAILALIALNVTLVNNDALKTYVMLEKIEALGGNENSGSGSGSCRTTLEVIELTDENGIMITYDCEKGGWNPMCGWI